MAKSKKVTELEQQIGELTQDLQRTRADFENYRKRADEEKLRMREAGAVNMVTKLLPVIDDIDRAISHIPKELKDNKWAQGIVSLSKRLEKSLNDIDVKRISAKPGDDFDPEVHNAVQIDEEAEGEKEVIDEQLQAGYTLNGSPIRPAMVKVTRK